jgi:hypothetical protein
MGEMKKIDGLKACEEAFERLVSGSPLISSHVGIIPKKITSGIVSVEAGFDRGYLKSARRNHQSLIAKITSYQKNGSSLLNSGGVNIKLLDGARTKLAKLESDLAIAVNQRAAVIAQNVQLHERVRILEQLMARLQPNVSYVDGRSNLA